MNTDGELEEFLDERPEKGVEVDGLLRTRYDSESENVLEMIADAWVKIVVEEDEGPGSLHASLEGSKTVSGQSKRNVTRVLKKHVFQFPPIDGDILGEEGAIVLRVHNIDDGSRDMLVLHASVLHILGGRLVCEESLESRSNREVYKSLASLARGVKPRFRTVRAGCH